MSDAQRSLLKFIAAIAAGTGQVGSAHGSSGGSVLAGGEKAQSKQFIEAGDGTNLFFRDWGKGRPMVFAAPWGLNSAWWEYQMADLAGRGLRCVGHDRRGHGRSGEPNHGYEFDTLRTTLRRWSNNSIWVRQLSSANPWVTAKMVRYRHASVPIASREWCWSPRLLRSF